MPAEVIHEETMEEEDRKTHGSPDHRTQQTAFGESKYFKPKTNLIIGGNLGQMEPTSTGLD